MAEMMFERKTSFRVATEYQPLLRMIGLDAQGVFTDPRIVPWRQLSDRENCTLDAELGGAWRAPKVRLHVKRYFASRTGPPAEDEARGHQALSIEKIPTAPLIGWGVLADGRSFTLFEDLAGYQPADKLVESGTPFAGLLGPTADLAAALHWAGLHHRDLYLCHFMARIQTKGADPEVDLKLIDTARVRRLPGILTRRRWVVKDLAQFWYSTTKLPVTHDQRLAWLGRYAKRRNIPPEAAVRLLRAIERKARSIARHDRSLNLAQPNRNVSIPVEGAGNA
jgi:hypothetical protein